MIPLTKEQMEVVAISLLTTKTIEEVIQKTGISRSSIERVRKTDKFNLILESKKHEIFGETMQKAQAMAQDALSVLSDIMHDSDATSSARVSASTKILDLALESNNRDTILKQIEELKGMINDE